METQRFASQLRAAIRRGQLEAQREEVARIIRDTDRTLKEYDAFVADQTG
jgi:hypothetical protein